ncbi:MAG: hypothetical protein ACK5ZR_09260 [Gemmatimonadaceae bacterium]|jgi:hypothetical protein
MIPIRSLALIMALVAVPVVSLQAQGHQHTPGMTHPGATAPSTAVATEGGQAAFAAIGEIVRLLEADPHTDWSKVDLERLRRHLIDMDLVTLRARVTGTPVTGGARFVVRGTGDAIGAIKRMTAAHAGMVAMDPAGPRLVRTELPDGASLVVTARDSADTAAVAKIRGLSFIGLMASGDHHTTHHLMLARGDAMANHGH